MNKGKEIKGISGREYQRLKNLMNFCLINKKGSIIGVRGSRKKLIYGIFIVETRGNKTMLFVVNTPQSREKNIGYFAINEFNKESVSRLAAGRGFVQSSDADCASAGYVQRRAAQQMKVLSNR